MCESITIVSKYIRAFVLFCVLFFVLALFIAGSIISMKLENLYEFTVTRPLTPQHTYLQQVVKQSTKLN